jgi:hypothetical protein
MEGNIIINEPLLHSHEKLFGPFKTEDYINSTSKLVTYSDIGMNIEVLWSFDGSRDQVIKYTLRSPMKMKRSEALESKTRFFYILITRGDKNVGEVNKELWVEVFTLWNKPQPQERKIEVVKSPTVQMEPRDLFEGLDDDMRTFRDDMKSPVEGLKETESEGTKRSSFKKLFGKSPKNPKPIDYRLPGFIPKGALLYGDISGNVTILPRPQILGSYLCYGEDGPIWCLPALPPSGKDVDKIKLT